MRVNSITFKKPIDFHCHFRQGKLLPYLVWESSQHFAKALAMPNTSPPVSTPEDVASYSQALNQVKANIEFLLTFKVMETTNPEDIPDLKEAGAVAGKLYPNGVTTNSDDGVEDFKSLYPVFEEMQHHNLVLCVHAEMPGSPAETAEIDFIPVLADIVENFPNLRVVFEHISTAAGVEFVRSYMSSTGKENLGATVTPHHLLLSKKDVFGKGNKIANPYHFCKPVCKTTRDRQILQKAILLDHHPAFFLGTDSAPHPQEAKEKTPPNAGIYSARTAIPLLFEEFIIHDCLDNFEDFTSNNGERFYNLKPHDTEITLVRDPARIPEFWEPYFGLLIKPLGAGQETAWGRSSPPSQAASASRATAGLLDHP